MNRNPYDPHDIDPKEGIIIGRDTLSKPNKAYTYNYKNKSFYVPGRGSINFTTKSDKTYQSTLWEIILEYFELNDSNMVKIPKTEIISKVSKRLKEPWHRDKLRENLRHLKEKIHSNKDIEGLILLRTEQNDIIFNFNIPSK